MHRNVYRIQTWWPHFCLEIFSEINETNSRRLSCYTIAEYWLLIIIREYISKGRTLLVIYLECYYSKFSLLCGVLQRKSYPTELEYKRNVRTVVTKLFW